MKKIKMFAAVAMFCAAAFAGYTAYDQATMTNQEKLIIANVEALSGPTGEDTGAVRKNCGLIWGEGCYADNYGATCSDHSDCSK